MGEHGERKGFLLGDGAGVGKGRTIAGIIYENILNKRTKAVWISISSDLVVDAKRDMDDVGIDSGFPLFNITSCTYKPIRYSRGVLFSTYASLISKKNNAVGDEHKQRLEQIIEWCGHNFDGISLILLFYSLQNSPLNA